MKIVTVEKYGFKCKQNVAMDILRQTECLCLNCKKFGTKCLIASELFDITKKYGVAFCVTRCPNWSMRQERNEEINVERRL